MLRTLATPCTFTDWLYSGPFPIFTALPFFWSFQLIAIPAAVSSDITWFSVAMVHLTVCYTWQWTKWKT
jgi:hypothetical protein